MKKKIISLCLVVILALTAIGGATLAYFTDTDEATNTFTLGSVKIKLHEGAYKNVLKNGAPINENGELDISKANPNNHKNETNFGYDYLDDVKNSSYKKWLDDQTLMPGGQDFNRMQKRIFVENTGSHAAYVRVIFGVPTELDNANGVSSKNILHFNQVTGEVNNKLGNWVNIQNSQPAFTQDVYNYYIVYYTEAVPAGEATNAEALSYFWLDGNVDYNNKTGKYVYKNDNGELVNLTSIQNGKINIPVYAEAIQATGFDTYTAAWTAYGKPAIQN